MAKQRIITVVTGTRAEAGLLRPVMEAIAVHPQLSLRVVATGMHVAEGTWRELPSVDAKVSMQRKNMTGREADVAALGRGVAGLGKVLTGLETEVVLVLGDRIEAFAAASAASVGGVCVAHLHGGDRAEGVADEAMRHAITKLAHLHFPATATSRRRIIRMGEPAKHVWNVGSPAIDYLRGVKAAADAPEIIVLQHPVGATVAAEKRFMLATLKATDGAPRMVFSPNHDPGRDGIVAAISGKRIDAVPHVPRDRFLSLLKGTRVIVGNSSAGLIEAAALRTACVNIGSRQAGREQGGNVVDASNDQAQIQRAIIKAAKLDLKRLRHPYGNGRCGERVASVLARLGRDDLSVTKRNSY